MKRKEKRKYSKKCSHKKKVHHLKQTNKNHCNILNNPKSTKKHGFVLLMMLLYGKNFHLFYTTCYNMISPGNINF